MKTWRAPRPRAAHPLTLVLVACAAAACEGADEAPGAAGDTPSAATPCPVDEVSAVVTDFGARLQRVSTTAPDSLVAAAVRAEYAPFVTAELLDAWAADPSSAPGREVSSPWPERIEVGDVRADREACVVEGEVVLVTSVEAGTGGAAVREPVTVRVEPVDGEWRITAYTRSAADGSGEPPALPGGAAAADTTEPASGAADSTEPASSSAQAATDVIRRYYAAIDAGEYRAAYALWADGGARSGQSYEEFAAGFAGTTSVEVDVGDAGRVEGAAGSRYVTVPVEIRAATADGRTQRLSGSYTLRMSVVDGATEAQRSWRIHAAEIGAG